MSITGITVKLIGKDGNAFGILGTVLNAMKANKCDLKLIDEYQTKAMSGDYNNLLRVTMEYVDVE